MPVRKLKSCPEEAKEGGLGEIDKSLGRNIKLNKNKRAN